MSTLSRTATTDGSSVQVMLFSDRLEVMNSGGLPPTLTVEKLRVAHQSVLGNPLLAESMYLRRTSRRWEREPWT